MSEEKNFNEENEEVTEVTEEETVTEAAEEAVEETAVEEAAAEETAESAAEAMEDAVETEEANVNAPDTEDVIVTDDASVTVTAPAKKVNKGAVIAVIVAAVLVIALVVLGILFAPKVFNKYNRMGYVDISGRTVGEVAEEANMDLDEFLEQYGLPADMPSNTTEAAAYNNIPCSNMAATYGMDFATMKELLKFPDEVTEDTPWGEALSMVTLGNYIGEDNLEDFKQQYGLGDEVNKDTLWGDVRQTVEEHQREEFLEQQKAMEEEEAANEAGEAEDKDASTEGNADETENAPATEASPAA